MRTPPFLLGAALLFWGWQSGLFAVGALLAALLEGARWSRPHWELSDEDFSRIWTLCSVIFLGATIYCFTANEGPARFGEMFQKPSSTNEAVAGIASARTVINLLRWLPMIFFLFVGAQCVSARDEIPWTTISQISRWRWKRAQKLGHPGTPTRGVNVAYPYFAICLFAASAHSSEDSAYFWGLSALLAWALWAVRPRRFRLVTWMGSLLLAIGLGYAGEQGAGRLQSYLTNLNPEWLSQLIRHRSADPTRSRTSIGQIGTLKLSGRIVIRIKPESSNAPTYLREASYDHYQTPDWTATSPRDRFDILPPESTNSTTWLLLPEKTNTAETSIACYLDGVEAKTGNAAGLLPLPEGAGRLENLLAFLVRKNSVGGMLAEGPRLVIFDAAFGPGATLDTPPVTNLDLKVPPEEVPGLDQVIAQYPARGKTTDEWIQIINGFFQSHFSYSLSQSRPRARGTNATPISRFLLETRRGHCEYFATATVLLLRELGIPARYAVGYLVHERSGKGYLVRDHDAHAWCLYWNEPSQSWEVFDTTPSSWVQEESKRLSLWQRVSDFSQWLVFEFSKFRWGQAHLRQYLLYALAPVLLLLVYQIIFKRKRRSASRQKRGAEAAISWPGTDSEFYLVEKALAARGPMRASGEPLSVWLHRAAGNSTVAGVSAPLDDLLRLHYRYRFDPQSLSEDERAELRTGAKRVLEEI